MTFTIRNLTYLFQHRPLITDISLNFEPGLFYAVLGPNGSGKSTLLKTLARILMPSSGQLFWKNKNLLNLSRKEISQIISLVPQNPQFYFDFTVYQMTLMGRYSLGTSGQNVLDGERSQSIEEALRQVDAWHLRDRPISILSGGEKQRVYIARAIVSQAPILLLDEPTSNLDLRHQLEIWQHLRILVKKGKLVIAALHDIAAVERFCDEVIVLNQGRCHISGNSANVLTPTLLQEIFGVMKNKENGYFIPCTIS